MRKANIIPRITPVKIQPQNGANAQKERNTLIRKHLIRESGRGGGQEEQRPRAGGTTAEVEDGPAGPHRTPVENRVLAYFYERSSHTFISQICTEHMAYATGLYQALQIQQEQSRYDPCSCKSFQQILQRGTASWMRIYSLNFVTCCPTARFGVWSALPEAICVLGEQTPQSFFLTKSGSLAQHRSSLSQSEMLGSRSCLGPEGCHILTDPRVQIWQS